MSTAGRAGSSAITPLKICILIVTGPEARVGIVALAIGKLVITLLPASRPLQLRLFIPEVVQAWFSIMKLPVITSFKPCTLTAIPQPFEYGRDLMAPVRGI